MHPSGFPTYQASSATDWRRYLAANHDQLANTWLVLYKKDSGVPSLTYEEARDEALCYGWIDSKPNKRDADSYYLFFAKRNPKSNWSRVNKERIAALEAAGKLAPPGVEMIAEAKRRGTWDALNDVENLIVPEDLASELDKYPDARAYWDAFPPSTRRGILEWIFNAKRAPTRTKRIVETAELAAENKRANQYPRQ
ncbi:MAG: YdeI/OmpD-associated family protein [Bacteroidota bacterium]